MTIIASTPESVPTDDEANELLIADAGIIANPDTTVFITEAEVRIATAANLGARREGRRWFVLRRHEPKPKVRRHYPPRRSTYVEYAAMSREMYRL
jgi:hypothetical protein